MWGLSKLRDMRLRVKLLAVYLGLSIALFSFGGWGALILIERAVESTIESDLRHTTSAIINMVETTAQGSIKNYLRAVAERNLDIARRFHQQQLEGDLTEAQARQEIRRILLAQTIGKTGYIYCIDREGVAVVHPRPEVEGNNWAHFEFVRQQILKKTGYLEYHWQNPGEPSVRPKALYMAYFAPYDWIISVSSYRDEFQELLPMEELRRSIRDLKVGPSGYAFVADRQGRIIFHPELEGRNLTSMAGAESGFFDEMVAKGFGQVTYRWQNPGDSEPRDKLAVFGYIPELQWIVGSTGYLEEIYAPLRQARTATLLFIGLAVVASSLLTVLVSNSITRRLGHLVAVISRGDRGDLTVRAEPGADDEIGRLSRIFNAFMERLQSSHRRLAEEVEEHRSTASSLRQAHDFNALVLATVDALVIVLDRDGRVVGFNRACEECSGYAAPDVIGRRPFTRLIPEEERDDVRAAFAELVEERRGNRTVNHWITKDGRRRLIQWSNAVTRDTGGRTELIVCAGIDVTDRRAAECALEERDAQFEAVFNQTYQLIGILDPDGTLRSANQTALDFAGVEEAHMVGQKFWEAPSWRHSGEDQARIRHAVERAARGEFSRMEVTHVRHDGEMRVFDFSLKPVRDASGRISMLIPEGRDITERKRMEAQLLHSQKMDAVGTLAGGIAHDFNNNLQAISGFTQLLRLEGVASSRQLEMLDTIQHACDHARELTRQLLTFGRKIDSQLVPLDINAELQPALTILQRTLPRMIEIETRLTDDLRIVEADATQFEQVVMNLGINAGHAMPGGGRLIIETMNVDLDEGFCRTHLGAEPGSYAMLSITDSGCGMDADTRAHIFEPFFTTRETGAGTGLGLAMVYGIVKNHRGYITCSSEPGRGTTFTIYFPAVAKVPIVPAHADDGWDAAGGNESILIVDDDPALRRLARELLERVGYRTDTAQDGETALARIRERGTGIDLVILDLNMPGMGGLRCLEEIAALAPAMPVLVASGYWSGGETKARLDRLARGFVFKPYTLNALLKAVRETLDGRR